MNPFLQKISFVAALGVSTFLFGCASDLSSGAYSRDSVRGEQSVRLGTVDSVREVKIEGTKTPIGTAAGGVVGGLAGSTIGGGKGTAVGAVLGAVAGGVAGAAAEEGFTRKKGVEVIVKMDNGTLTAITQQTQEGEVFTPGDRVKVISGSGVTRVTK